MMMIDLFVWADWLHVMDWQAGYALSALEECTDGVD